MEKNYNFDFCPPRIERSFVMQDYDGRDFIQKLVWDNGLLQYEAPLPGILISYLSHNEGTFIDIGANTGLYTLIAASISPGVDVVAFEPLHDIYMKLVHNIELNKTLTSRIKSVRAALSRSSSKMQFYETINELGYLSTSSTLDFDHVQHIRGDSNANDFRAHEVVTTTLDEWTAANSLNSAALIKIDAEGHDHAVLQGGLEFVRRVRPVIAVEMLAAANYPFFQEFVDSNNYVSFLATTEFLKRERNIRFEPRSWNHILCPAEKTHGVVVAASATHLQIR